MKISHGELAQMEQAAKNRADNSDRCVFAADMCLKAEWYAYNAKGMS